MTGQTEVKPRDIELHQKQHFILTGPCKSGDTGALLLVISGGTQVGDVTCSTSDESMAPHGCQRWGIARGIAESRRNECVSVGWGWGGRGQCPETLYSDENDSFLSLHVGWRANCLS